MHNLLKIFWEWFPLSYDEYAEKGIHQSSGEREEYFQYFSQLLVYAKSIIENNKIDEESIDDLLTILALDNEMESILELIVEKSSNEQLQRIIYYGIKYPLYNTRWQLAEIVYKRKPAYCKEYLLALSHDSHHYVRKRARNCLNYMGLKLS